MARGSGPKRKRQQEDDDDCVIQIKARKFLGDIAEGPDSLPPYWRKVVERKFFACETRKKQTSAWYCQAAVEVLRKLLKVLCKLDKWISVKALEAAIKGADTDGILDTKAVNQFASTLFETFCGRLKDASDEPIVRNHVAGRDPDGVDGCLVCFEDPLGGDHDDACTAGDALIMCGTCKNTWCVKCDGNMRKSPPGGRCKCPFCRTDLPKRARH